MLKFYYGAELEKLADQLLQELNEHPLEDPLDEELFVVQNHGIGQWLSLQIAEKEGIAANLKFEFPSERIWSLIRLMDDDIPHTLPSDRGPMTWTLMEFFKSEQFLDQFENLRHYIEEKDPERRAMRSWKLGSKIADVFDQYLIYRPQMILDWEQRKLYTQSVEAEKWQSKLWNTLIGRWKEKHQEDQIHRAQLLQRLWNAIEKGVIKKNELPDRISVFGVSDVSPAFIKTMVKLSELTKVHFYQLLVDPVVTKSEQFKNPLLQSLAQEGTTFMSLFSGCTEVDPNDAGKLNTPESSLFNAIQSDLKNDDSLSGLKLNVPSADQSLQVHNCHSPMREVEVLYDQLLALMDNNPELSPDEILIMTPDIEMYAPFIEAVFATPDKGQPEIPYAIADRGVEQQPVADTFLKILELSESRFKVTDVLDLLDDNAIREAFGFNEEELSRIEQWVKDNQIRWGIDGNDKKDLGLPNSDHFTWRAGLRRVLLGYVMRSSDDQLYNDIYAYHEVETSDDADLAGKMSFFLNQLFAVSNRTDIVHTPGEWSEILHHIVDDFFPDNREFYWELTTIRKGIDKLEAYASLAGYNHKIPFSIIRRWLTEQLNKHSTGGGRMGRGVTFSSLMPMRSIPFEVIGMIGMNEGAFPRSKIPIEFDLMHLDREVGDPVPSEQHRYLFLENLLSARSHIYFSYVGQSNRQDTDFPPSVVLRELIDYLEEYYGINSDDLINKHPLQAFSPAYYNEDEHLISYSSSQLDISRELTDTSSTPVPFLDGALPEPDEEWKHLALRELVTFFQHPSKYLLQNRLGIYLREEDVLTEEREPFTLGGLKKYKVGQELLDRFFKDKPLEPYQKHLQAKDLLPEGWSGQRAFREQVEEVRDFGENMNWILDQREIEDLEVDLRINNFRLTGMLSDVYQNARIAYRFGSMRPKDVIDLWIKHLCLQAVKPDDHPGTSRLFTRHKRKDFAEYRLGSVDDYEVILKELLEMYWQGLQQCCYFFPESAFVYAEEVCDKNGDSDTGLYKASNQWLREYSSYPGEGEDPYNKLLLGSENPLQKETFKKASEQFWGPFFDAIQKGED